MIDWQWIPGVVASGGVGAYAVWLHRQMKGVIPDRVRELNRQIIAQQMHGLQLWPRPWLGGRPLTQVEEIVDGYGFQSAPIPPEDQLQQMQADAQRLLDSYEPERDSDA